MFGCDYNPCIVGAGGLYHQWLAQTYGTPDKLPYRDVPDSFEAVLPPRALGDDVEANLQWYLDWIACKEWLLAHYLAVLAGFHAEAGLDGVNYYTNLNPHRPEGVPTNFQLFGEATGGLVGYDFYRSPWLTYSGYCSMARVLKLMTATLPITWSAEFMGGWWYTDMGRGRIPKSHTECMGLAAMANGCQALSWFMFHDRRSWGDSPVSEMGHRRENHAALKQILEIRAEVPAWEELLPVTDLAVAYYRPYMWHSHLGDAHPCADNSLHIGQPVLWDEPAGAAVAGYEAILRYLQQAGYTTAVVDLDEDSAGWAQHRAIWLVGAPFVRPEDSAKLRQYVENGGWLIVSHCWPRLDFAGYSLAFLDLPQGLDAAMDIGKGRVSWLDFGAPSEAGLEAADTVAAVKLAVAERLGPPVVDASRPLVRYETGVDGQVGWVEEAAVFVEAILHQGAGEQLLYLVNLHQRATTVSLAFRDLAAGSLQELGFARGQYTVADGRAEVDIDRKSVRVFRIQS